MQHRWNDARGPVGWRGHNATARGIFLIHCQGIQVDPVQNGQWIAHTRFGTRRQLLLQSRRAPPHVQSAGQGAFLASAAPHAGLHDIPHGQQAVADVGFPAPDSFVGEHQLRDAQSMGLTLAQQLVAAMEGIGQVSGVGNDAVLGGLVLIDHKASAHRVVVACGKHIALCVVGEEAHAVGVERQLLALVHDEIGLLAEVDLMLTEQPDACVSANACQRVGDCVGVDPVRLMAFETQQYCLVRAVPPPSQSQRTKDLGAHACGVPQQAFLGQSATDKTCGSAHGSDGVRGRRTDSDLEQIEHADSHGILTCCGGAPV